MWKRSLISVMAACAALIFPSFQAAAQPIAPVYARYVRAHQGLADLTALFRPNFVPVRIRAVEGPSVLKVGERGAFTAYANVEAATLPLQSRWDFGDGTTAAGLAAAHAFEAPGAYRVFFTLANDGSEDYEALTVRVLPADPAPEAPAEATSDPKS